MPVDFLYGPGDIPRADPVPGLNQLYLIVQDVEGLPSGSNVYKHERAALEQLKVGNFREQAGY